MSGPLLRILGQVAIAGVSVFSRAFLSAYQQAVQNAKKGGSAASAASAIMKNTMSKSQALSILNITEKEATPEIVKKQYDRYFNSNAVEKGGSFYIQSKVYRANELMQAHFKEMEKQAADRMAGKKPEAPPKE
jgi:import inner membrane translocase subunit TIM16